MSGWLDIIMNVEKNVKIVDFDLVYSVFKSLVEQVWGPGWNLG